MRDMVVRERRDGEVAMIVPLVIPDADLGLPPRRLRRRREVLRQQLLLLVEVVVGALAVSGQSGQSASQPVSQSARGGSAYGGRGGGQLCLWCSGRRGMDEDVRHR